MTERVLVTGGSLACASGRGLAAVWRRLNEGGSDVRPLRRFDTASLVCHHAATLPELDPPHADPVWRLMSLALEDFPPPPRDAYLFWAGVKSSVAAIEGGSPETAAPGWHRGKVAKTLGLTGGGLDLNAACASSTAALALAGGMIRSGEVSSAVVCAADIVSRFVFSGFAALRALSPTRCAPFDAARDGLILGEAAVVVELMSERLAARRGAVPLAELAGWGMANDATHITAPARDGRGLILAIRSALDKARLSADEVEAFCAHGTGTAYNDAMELTALEALFGERKLPVFSVKGAFGHTLGAAGAAELTLCAKALETRQIPPTAGFVTPEPRAVGLVSARPMGFAGNTILTSNSGFGGVNAALLLKRL